MNLEPEYLEIIEKLAISPENVVIVSLIGGMEVIGEHIDLSEISVSEEDSNSIIEMDEYDEKIYIANPVKIMKESYINAEGEYTCNCFFVEWNVCSDQAFLPLNPSAIMTVMTPNEYSLKGYITAVNDMYFGSEEVDYLPEEVTPIEDKKASKAKKKASKKNNNVINFSEYKKV